MSTTDYIRAKEDEAAEKYPQGSTVTFGDSNATTQKEGETVLASGPVNGHPLYFEPTDTVLIPVWCERDGGREPTTVYVNEKNVVSVELPPRLR